MHSCLPWNHIGQTADMSHLNELECTIIPPAIVVFGADGVMQSSCRTRNLKLLILLRICNPSAVKCGVQHIQSVLRDHTCECLRGRVDHLDPAVATLLLYAKGTGDAARHTVSIHWHLHLHYPGHPW